MEQRTGKVTFSMLWTHLSFETEILSQISLGFEISTNIFILISSDTSGFVTYICKGGEDFKLDIPLIGRSNCTALNC